MKKKVAITIPIYKETPSDIEMKSFIQCLTIFQKYDIYIFTHKNLNFKNYDSCKKGSQIHYIFFHENYFKSIDGYNKLMLSPSFYKAFSNYEYILIYQLDAWVFKDELQYWCNQKYDYIGAPIYQNNKLIGIGNGGFSLRKVDYCLKVLKYPKFLPFIKLQNIKLIQDKQNRKILLPLKLLGWHNNISYFKNRINEDLFFSLYAKLSFLNTNIPEFNDAIKFAFEKNPSKLYIRNSLQLPFGCHAFMKYEYIDFWKEHIKL